MTGGRYGCACGGQMRTKAQKNKTEIKRNKTELTKHTAGFCAGALSLEDPQPIFFRKNSKKGG